jgi:hypothetical protein
LFERFLSVFLTLKAKKASNTQFYIILQTQYFLSPQTKNGYPHPSLRLVFPKTP